MLLRTKLFPPIPHREMVARTRLMEKLDELPRRKLTLISAPAGFGKTTLISRWAEEHRFPTAWLSLDSGDNDIRRFLSYLVASIGTLHPERVREITERLEAPTIPPPEVILSELINQISSLEEPFLLVIDDYHTIDQPSIHESLLFMIERMPQSMRLAITTRADPPIPLARFRVRGDLIEIRASDLRFSDQESAALFSSLTDLALSPVHLATLQRKTEGWVAGLQMAALSLQGRSDIESFIADFAGTDRYVLDYLLEETLSLLPEELQRTLLSLSILDIFNGTICETVTGAESGAEMLAELERRNLFVIPLDNKREFYRYHHLFADLLQHRLQQLYAEVIPELHRRASRAYASQGQVLHAVDHAVMAGDPELSAEMLATHWRVVLARTTVHFLRKTIDALPDTLVDSAPAIGLLRAWSSLHTKSFEEREEELIRVEESMERIEIDQRDTEILGHTAFLRAALARDRGDAQETARHAARAIELIPDHPLGSPEYIWNASHVMIYNVLGSARQMAGDMEGAESAFEISLHYGRTKADAAGTAVALSKLGPVQLLLGRLSQAARTAQELQGMIDTQQLTLPGIRANPHEVMAGILYERYGLEGARAEITKATERSDFPRLHVVGALSNRKALIEITSGNWDAAQRTIDELERSRFNHGGGFINWLVSMLRTQLQFSRGENAEEAIEWAVRADDGTEKGSEINDYVLTTSAGILSARILLAHDRVEDAAEKLDLLRRRIESAQIIPQLLEVMALQSAVLQRRGREEEAMATALHAIRLGSPEGFIRPFIHGGKEFAWSLSHLLRTGASRLQGISRDYIHQLAETLGVPTGSAPMPIPGEMTPLSGREMEILQLMSLGYSNPRIADRLYLSVNTIKTHISTLFDKLGVHNRIEALQRAKESKLL